MSKVIVESSSRISWKLSFCGWLVLLVTPLILLNIAFEQYDSFVFSRNVAFNRPFLFNELSSFSDDLSLKKWLQKKFDGFNRNFDKVSYEAENLRVSLQKCLGTKVLAVFHQDFATGRISRAIDNGESLEFKAPPDVFVKRIFEVFAKWHLLDDSERHKSAEIRLFRSFFGNIAEFALLNGKIFKTISAKFGDTGPVYFQFYRDEKSKNSYLALIKEKSIKPESVIAAAINSAKGEIKRRIVFPNKRLALPWNFEASRLSKLRENSQGIKIRQLLPPENFVHIVQKGGIVPQSLDKYLNDPPMLCVQCNREHLQGSLSHYRRPFSFLSRLLFLFGTMMFFRLSLWGANFKLSISMKIFMSLLLAGLFPLSIFVFAYSAFTEYGKINQVQQAQRVLQQKVAAIKKRLNSGISQIELENVKMAIRVQQAQNVEERNRLLREFLAANKIDVIFLQDLSGIRELFFPAAEKPPDERWRPQEMKAFEVFVFQIIEILNLSPILKGEVGAFGRIIDKVAANRTSVNIVIESVGKVQRIEKLAHKFWFACLLLFGENEQKTRVPQTLLFPGFLVKKILNEQLHKAYKQFPLSEKRANWQIDMAIALINGKELALSPENCSVMLDKDKIMDKLRLANLLKRDLVWEADGEIEVALFDDALPYICFGRIRSTLPKEDLLSGENLKVVFFIILSGMMILLVANLFFVSPVKKVADEMMRVGAGDLEFSFTSVTGDEFDQLAGSLNSMLRGIKERKILSEYVSEDVQQEVATGLDAEFAPGGELLEAAILFCEPIQFNAYASESDPERVLAYLNVFVTEIARICRDNGGIIDKMIENSLMLVFRHKTGEEQHSLRAARAAIEISRLFSESFDGFPFACKLGLASGAVISGKIGSRIGKLDFTVIGDTVNFAARLKSMAEMAGATRILTSEKTAIELKNKVKTRFVASVEIKGKAGKHEVFELLAL
jgi:class 3 adenylate cyclase